MADFCQAASVSDILGSFLGRDDSTRQHDDASGDEKPLDKTGDLTEETTSSSFMYDNSTSFASWLSSQDFDNGNIAVPSVPDSPHLLGIDPDDDTYLSEEVRHDDGTSPEETYDGSKPVAEWLSSRDTNHVVVTSPSTPQRRNNAQFEGLLFKSAHESYEGGTKIMSPDDSSVCDQTKNEAMPTTLLGNFYNDSARLMSETCGCTIITQLNDLLDTRHCDGDIQDGYLYDDNHHQDVMIGANESFEVPLHNEFQRHLSRCSGSEVEETSEAEREDLEEFSLNASFESHDDVFDDIINEEETNIYGKKENDDCLVPAVSPENSFGEEIYTSEKDEKADGLVPAVTAEKELNDGEEVLKEEEDFPLDEMNAPAVTPSKSLDEHIDEGTRLKLSQMLLATSLFQPEKNEWSTGFLANNDSWRSGCSSDGDDMNTVDLESLDDVLNDRNEIFRNTESRAPPSLSQGVHLLGASFEDSPSSDHDSVFQRVLHEENRVRQISVVDVSPLKKVAETRKSFSYEDDPRGSKSQDHSHLEGHHSSKLSSVSSRERGPRSNAQPSSRREDSHSKRSSVKGGKEEPEIGKENTIIVMSIRGRKGKDKYARHARKQRLANKAGRDRLPP